MEDAKVRVFLNGSNSQHAEVDYHPRMAFEDFTVCCQERLGLQPQKKVRLFDLTGDEIYEDDFDMLDPSEPIFLSLGEGFDPASSLAVYESERPLGEGGFGTVELYRHRFSGAQVAIKSVPLSSLESTEDVSRVFGEVAILRKLKHFNIVQMLDALLLPDRICLIMEFCQGGELKTLIETEVRLSEDKAYSIALQLVSGIRYCHDFYVIHRDLKLENVLFADRMQQFVKIVDFGISGAFKVGAASERSDAGSLPYAAPEVITGADNRARPALDVWGLGCIFYYMVVGKHPFLAESLRESIRNIETGRYHPLPPDLSPPWRHVINGALQVSRTRRWSVSRIEEHLQRHRDDPKECPECTQGMEEEKTAEPASEPIRFPEKKAGKKTGLRSRKTLS